MREIVTMNTIRFILDGELVEIDNIDPTRTVLQYLREDQSSLWQLILCF